MALDRVETVSKGFDVSPPVSTGLYRGHFKTLFFRPQAIRGHNPALVNVGATDTDKRSEPGIVASRAKPFGPEQIRASKGIKSAGSRAINESAPGTLIFISAGLIFVLSADGESYR
jgi:hypothetical protein